MRNGNAKRVVITGIGTVNPLGLNAQETWASLLNGKSGIGKIESFDPEESGMRTRIAGEVKEFEPENWMDRKEARRMDRFSQFALASAKEAVAHSGLKLEGDTRYEVGVLIGSGIGGLATIVEQSHVVRERGARRVSPFTVPMLMPNGRLRQRCPYIWAAGAPASPRRPLCASSADSLGVALDMIRNGRAKAMVVGGSEATIIPVCVASYRAGPRPQLQQQRPAGEGVTPL